MPYDTRHLTNDALAVRFRIRRRQVQAGLIHSDPMRERHHRQGYTLFVVEIEDVRWWIGGDTTDMAAVTDLAWKSAEELDWGRESQCETSSIGRIEALTIKYHDDEDKGVTNMWTAFLNTPGPNPTVIACSEW